MSTRWGRWASLRALMHQQALTTYHASQEALDHAQRAAHGAEEVIRNAAEQRSVSGALIQLYARAATHAANHLEALAEPHERATTALHEAAVERRQVDWMVEHAKEVRVEAERRAENRAVDDWSSAKRPTPRKPKGGRS